MFTSSHAMFSILSISKPHRTLECNCNGDQVGSCECSALITHISEPLTSFQRSHCEWQCRCLNVALALNETYPFISTVSRSARPDDGEEAATSSKRPHPIVIITKATAQHNTLSHLGPTTVSNVIRRRRMKISSTTAIRIDPSMT